MKKKPDNLVSEFFENISWKILEGYPRIINEMIRGKAGLYALYRRDRLYYVGLTVNLKKRLNDHKKDRHKELWDRFSVYLVTDDGHTKPLESLVLRIASLPGNKVTGKIPGAIDQRKSIEKQMKDIDANKRASVLGGTIAKKRIKATVQKNGTSGLKGVAECRYALKATYKDKTFKATLRKDGQISFNGMLYSSPTAAAMKATSRSAINGRAFWKYRNEAGKWVALNHLIG